MKTKKFVIGDHKTLGQVLDAFMESVDSEGVKAKLQKKALEEKEKQDSVTTGIDLGEDDDSSVDTDDDANPEKHDQNAMAKVPEFKDVVSKLNALRAGRSLKDDAVQASFEEYFGSLKDAEKVALFAFLKGISQVLSGQVSGENASDPADSPANVKMKKGEKGDAYDPDGDGVANNDVDIDSDEEGESKHIDPKVISPKGEPPKKKGGENTKPPIKVR